MTRASVVPSGVRLRVVLQGRFAVTAGEEPVSTPHSGQRVVAFLAIQGRPVERTTVAASLWGEATADRAGAALRTALWRLSSSPARRLLRTDGHRLALSDDVEIDFVVTARQAEQAVAGGAEDGTVALLRDAADLLPDWYDDWVIIERERFRLLRIDALERLCRELSAAGRYAEATQAGLAAVAAEPLRESAHHALVAAHLAEGNRSDALRQYALLGDLLRELGLEPSPGMREAVTFG